MKKFATEIRRVGFVEHRLELESREKVGDMKKISLPISWNSLNEKKQLVNVGTNVRMGLIDTGVYRRYVIRKHAGSPIYPKG